MCQSHELTTKRRYIVCLIQNITYLMQLSLSQMHMWKTTLVLKFGEKALNAGEININSGIFQRDSISPILFCVALILLANFLTIQDMA